jgi:hypothetical protein
MNGEASGGTFARASRNGRGRLRYDAKQIRLFEAGPHRRSYPLTAPEINPATK